MVRRVPRQRLTRLTDGLLSLSISNLASGRELTREDTGSALMLRDFYLPGFTPDPVQVTFPACRQAFPTGSWSFYGPYPPDLFRILPAITKSQLQQLFCHPSLSRVSFPPRSNKSGLSAHRGTPGAQDLTSLVIGLLTDTLPITKFKVGVDPTWFEISLSSLSVVGVGKG